MTATQALFPKLSLKHFYWETIDIFLDNGLDASWEEKSRFNCCFVGFEKNRFSYHSLSLEVWHHEPAIHHDHLVNQDAWTMTRSTRENSWNHDKRLGVKFALCSNGEGWAEVGKGTFVVPLLALTVFASSEWQVTNLTHKHISDWNNTFFSPNRVV